MDGGGPSVLERPAALSAEPVLQFAEVTKRFGAARPGGTPFTAIEKLSFLVREGEFLSVVGPSGCGKSTVLNLVAGLDRPNEGSIRLSGVPVTGPSLDVGCPGAPSSAMSNSA